MAKTIKAGAGGRWNLLAGSAAMAVLTGALPNAAQAQDAEEDIVVTGTRIPQPNLYTTSPVTQVTSEDITTQGATRVEDMINQLPQVFAANTATQVNGAPGTATLNLRGLGSPRTLVLMNGRRLPYGSDANSAVDINQVPGAIVDRVEILTGGASAVYGSDAVAGVVNFIMRTDFEGLRLDGQYGFYQHTNGYDESNAGSPNLVDVVAGREAGNPSEYQVPADDQNDGFSKEASVIFGAASDDGRANVMAYATYRSNEQILQRDRDFAACALAGGGGAAWLCGGSATSAFGTFATPGGTFTLDATGPGNTFRSSDAFVNGVSPDLFNFAPRQYFQRPDERYSLGAFGRYEINEHAEAFAELMFSDYQSITQIAPSGNFFDSTTINCDNPLLSAQQADSIGCNDPGVTDLNPATPGDDVTLYIGRRNVEGGNRRDNLGIQMYRGVLGVGGAINDDWSYEVAAQYAETTRLTAFDNDISITRLNRALDVVDVGGVPTCRSVVDGTDASCVPWDVFSIGGVTQEALNYIQIPLLTQSSLTQQVVYANLTGDLGFASPFAESNLQAAAGIEYRRDAIDHNTDLAYRTDDASGQGGAANPLRGEIDVMDVYGELRAPIIEGAPLADLVSLDLAYRRSSYSSGIETDTYKIGGEWAPTQDLRVRGSFQRAVRAANIVELFFAQSFSLFDMGFDPCDASARPAAEGPVPASCIGTNPWQVTLAQSASGISNPAGQYNELQGGNPDLTPEEADTYTIGFVATPSFLPGLNLSVDWFEIRVENTVSVIAPGNTVDLCFEQDITELCQLIERNPANGRLWTGDGRVQATNVNIGYLLTSGIDINANYSIDLADLGMSDNAGSVAFSLVGTWLEKLKTNNGDGLGFFDCVGGYGSVCGTPNPEWRHRFRVSWETPWDLELAGTWRHYGEVVQVNGNGVPVTGRLDSTFEAEDYFDFSAAWQVRENATVRFGVNNILDNDPPVANQNIIGTTGTSNTYPQTYDSLGRWIFAGVTVDF
ncbi:MAG: TonB-dependent receptor plug domain-containing protein [Hyphomonadaceae bacterium]